MNLIQKIIKCKTVGARRKRRAISALKVLYPKGFVSTRNPIAPHMAPNDRYLKNGGQFLQHNGRYLACQNIMDAVAWHSTPQGVHFWQKMYSHTNHRF